MADSAREILESQKDLERFEELISKVLNMFFVQHTQNKHLQERIDELQKEVEKLNGGRKDGS